MRIELIFEKTCPNIQLAREHLKKALKLLGFKAKWQEREITDPGCPAYAHGLGSPSIMINGRDVSDMITNGDDFSCRLYADEQGKAQTVYYTAVDQFHGEDRTGAMVATWSFYDPMRLDPGLGNATRLPEYSRTGLFIADAITDDPDNPDYDEEGRRFVYSELMSGSAEMFKGTITEIYADADFVLAAKAGDQSPQGSIQGDCATNSFPCTMKTEILKDTDTGGLYLANSSGELLIYTVRNGEGQFGLPYLLMGRVDMPYPEVFGLARQDDLVLVANGHGGIQVIDISNLTAPYHVGYIKPNGYSRDVAVKERFAFIAASHEGLVVADLADPSMPVVAVLDTLGVANRIHIHGRYAYITDMAGDGMVSQCFPLTRHFST